MCRRKMCRHVLLTLLLTLEFPPVLRSSRVEMIFVYSVGGDLSTYGDALYDAVSLLIIIV